MSAADQRSCSSCATLSVSAAGAETAAGKASAGTHRCHGLPRKTRDESRLLPICVIEVERSSQLLHEVSRESLQHLIDAGLPRAPQRIDELGLDTTITGIQLAGVRTGFPTAWSQ